MPSQRFERFAGFSALLAGVAGLLYAVAFIVVHQALFSAICLTLFGALAIIAWLAIYLRVRDTDVGFALLSLVLGLVGAIGGSIHGAYDLANLVNRPLLGLQQAADLPSQIEALVHESCGPGDVLPGICCRSFRRKGASRTTLRG